MVNQPSTMDEDESYERFLELLDSAKIKNYLEKDKHNLIADRYLLATVFLYFRKANFNKREYTRRNFFIGLYLAHDMQEDTIKFKDDIVSSFLGQHQRSTKHCYDRFQKDRFRLFQRLQYNCNVTGTMCEEVMDRAPHWAWNRVRQYKDIERMFM